MKHMPQIVNVMTPFPYHVDIDAGTARAKELLTEHGLRQLPVTSGGRVVGLVDDHDLARAAHSLREAYRPADIVEAHTAVDQVVERMADEHLNAVIVTKDEKLVGVFTPSDACRLLARLLRERFPPPQPGTEAA